MKIDKYSFGIGDRFGCQGHAQLKAIIEANRLGVPVIPVWNKSNREHTTIGSATQDTRIEADDAVMALNWTNQYFVDADHINMSNVDSFIDFCDFFTIDVADFIGKPIDQSEIDDFVDKNRKYLGDLEIHGIGKPLRILEKDLEKIASKYLFACKKASEIYKHIKKQKGNDFIPEVSMDEVKDPQSPVELLFILSALSYYGVPAQTIAPKFTGRFNKGVDYEGNLKQFEKEFEQDILIIDFAIREFGLPENLKLSVHSGSDKFSIYPVMGKIIDKYNKGIHVKTAGTTWLEEMIGLALAGNDALEMAKSIYEKAFVRQDELCGPYSTVIDIVHKYLPKPKDVWTWTGEQFANALRHIPDHKEYNPHFRQLIHVGYKIAAEFGEEYISLVKAHADIVGNCVTENILDRHIKRLFKL